MTIPTAEELRARFGQVKGGADTPLNNTWDCQVSDTSTEAEVLTAGFLDAVVEKLRRGDQVIFRTSNGGTVTTNVINITPPVQVKNVTGNGVTFIQPFIDGAIFFGVTTPELAAQSFNLIWDDTNQNLGIGGPPDPSASLDVKFTTQPLGVRLSGGTEVQRDAIISPVESLIFYNFITKAYDYFNGSIWRSFIYNPARANLYVSASAETTISTSNVYVKIAGTTTENLLRDFTSGADMQLTYTGTETHVFEVNVSMSLESSSAQEEFQVALFVDTGGGFVLHVPSEMDEQVRDANKSDALSFNTLIQLSLNDKIELQVKNITSPASIDNCTANKLTWIITQNGS